MMSTQTFLVVGVTGKTGHYTVPEFMIQHFCAVALDYQNGIFSGEGKMIAELTGKPPMTAAGAAGHNNTSGEHHSGRPSERQGGANVWDKVRIRRRASVCVEKNPRIRGSTGAHAIRRSL